MQKTSRNFFLFLSQNKTLNKSAKRWGFNLGAAKVVAGESIESAMDTVLSLNHKGILAAVDHLGEFVSSEQEAKEAAEHCLRTLEAVDRCGADCYLSLKLTQLGIDIDRELCFQFMKEILEKAASLELFVRIDMEDYAHCQPTLDMLKRLRKEYDNVGTVIQAYLYRASDDIDDLKGVPLRLVKGAYKESDAVAWQDKKQIDANFLNIIKQHLTNGSYTAIATHDHRIIEEVKNFTAEAGIPADQFEFQMLYGFRTDMQEALAQEGYRFRTYVPFGNDWYSYFMRRLAERPQNVSFAFKGMFSK
ncbi:proline dehydrogenase family protein [Sinobaca sp. H24]|uniref:proline dehydrogenase family protein n=1 Tax=Sinobaca sp. H24 TaxID=2923376 RepID=UPI00207B06F1|nr:proline dehydrogenase [Sinobaca sp. H24]